MIELGLGIDLVNARQAVPASSGPPAAPNAPTLTNVSHTGTTQTLSWVPNGSNGSAITSYNIYKGGVLYANVSSSPSTVTGLAPGTSYSYTVTAVNGIGESSASNTVTQTTNDVPGAPTSLSLGTPTTTTQPLSWNAPASNGGSSITGYNIYFATHGGSYSLFGNVAGTSGTVTGLTASTSYDYKVKAVNAVGEGSASNVVTGSTADPGAGGTPGAGLVGNLLGWLVGSLLGKRNVASPP